MGRSVHAAGACSCLGLGASACVDVGGTAWVRTRALRGQLIEAPCSPSPSDCGRC
jgi:hypothetical protein